MDYEPRGWHSRGYLPHFDGGEIAQFITLHLHDSMPQKVIDRWRNELEREEIETLEIQIRKRIERYLDQGYGACYLGQSNIALLVQDSLLHFDSQRYHLSAWVIMPNHIHFLLMPTAPHILSDIMHSIKSFTASKANKLLKRKGTFWQEDYFDRHIRDGKHFADVVAYIENNPVKAKLCKRPEDWFYGSAYLKQKTRQ